MHRVHLYTTDPSGLDLFDAADLDATPTAIFIPENRADAAKVHAVRARANQVPIVVHPRGVPLRGEVPSADIAVSWLYSQIIHASDLARYPRGTANFHGGFLPKYRGANVLQWAIVNGEDSLGLTWHAMSEAVDAGPIWAEGRIAIGPSDTAWTVRQRMIEGGQSLFPRAWRAMLERRPVRTVDPHGSPPWPSRRKSDGRLRQGLTRRQVKDLVRALCPPWPPAMVEVDGVDRAIERVTDAPVPGSMEYTTSDGTCVYLVLHDLA